MYVILPDQSRRRLNKYGGVRSAESRAPAAVGLAKPHTIGPLTSYCEISYIAVISIVLQVLHVLSDHLDSKLVKSTNLEEIISDKMVLVLGNCYELTRNIEALK